MDVLAFTKLNASLCLQDALRRHSLYAGEVDSNYAPFGRARPLTLKIFSLVAFD